MGSVVTIEEVTGGKGLVRFVELPAALHGNDPRFAPLVMAWERYRLDTRRNPYFDRGDGRFFLARRQGVPVGRIAAHLDDQGGAGRFGFWWLCDDDAVARALVEAAQHWLREQGCSSMTGPVSFTHDQEVGVQVSGHDGPGMTGRPWHPAHLAEHLERGGFVAVEDHPTWRLPAAPGGPERASGAERPGQAGRYVDPRLVLEGVAAVPDVAAALRTAALRGAWALAKRAKAGDWESATVVGRVDDVADAVPSVQAAAARAGYRWVIAPWSPDPAAPPEAVHRTYRLDW